MRILDDRSLTDKHLIVERVGNVWQLSLEGTLIAEARNTNQLSFYAIDQQGAAGITVLPWPGFHWRDNA